MMLTDQHECDLFLMSSHAGYFADNALTQFAEKGCRNRDGWGIGFYTNRHSQVVRSEKRALVSNMQTESISREFAAAIAAVSSPVVVGHLRLACCGGVRPENNHPFALSFLGYDWLLVHNGTAHNNNLVSPSGNLIPESDCDSARVFEFLESHIVHYCANQPKRSLIWACQQAYLALRAEDSEGKFNIILSNGYTSFAFIHWRPFYLIHREKDTGDAALLSTMPLTGEDWVEFRCKQGHLAKMLVFSGSTLLLNSDIGRK